VIASIPANNNGTKPAGFINVLHRRDIEDLAFFFRSYESIIGLRSQHEAFVAFVTDTSVPPADLHCNPYVDIFDDIRRGNSVYHVLLEMVELGQSDHVMVLHLLYGEPPPNAHYAVFGHELAPIAHLTDAVEEMRQDLADELAYNRVAKPGHAASAYRGAAREVLSSTALTHGIALAQDRVAGDFLTRVKSEARRLGLDACQAYLSAKEAVRASA
jgi:hypothetical protein